MVPSKPLAVLWSPPATVAPLPVPGVTLVPKVLYWPPPTVVPMSQAVLKAPPAIVERAPAAPLNPPPAIVAPNPLAQLTAPPPTDWQQPAAGESGALVSPAVFSAPPDTVAQLFVTLLA